jgi:hypothetical protein
MGRRRKPHVHRERDWDGYWATCRCGARRVSARYPWEVL